MKIKKTKSDRHDPPLIMVVEDDAPLRKEIVRFLKKDGYRTAEAEDGERAVQVCNLMEPSLVLMDTAMPKMDGITACAEIKKQSRGRKISILMVACFEDTEEVDDAFAAGAEEYVIKPIHWAVLRHRIKKILAHDALEHALRNAKEEMEDRVVSRSMELQRINENLRIHQTELEIQNEELRRAQVELEATRDRYTRLYDFAPVGYFTLEESGLIQEVNITGAALLGVDRQRLVGKRFARFVIREDQDLFHLHRNKILKSGELERCEIRIIKEDSPYYVRLESMADQGGDGEDVQWKTVVSDINERKRAEEALRLSEERFRNLFQFAPIGMAISTLDGVIAETNRSFQEMLGHDDQELRGMQIERITHPADRGKTGQLLQGLFSGERSFYQTEKRYLHKDGRVIWARVTAGGARGADGGLSFAFAMVQDITGQREAEAAMARFKEEVEIRERRRLARTLHDGAVQALQVVVFGLKTLTGQARDRQPVTPNALEEITKEISSIIEQLRNIATELHPSFLDRMELIHAIHWLGDKLSQQSGVSVRIDNEGELKDPEDRIKRNCFLIYQEGLTNAIKHSGAQEVKITIRENGGESCHLEISDRGQGFDPEKVKENSEGLGLSIIRERTERLGGALRIRSAPGQGTSIAIEVPIHGSNHLGG